VCALHVDDVPIGGLQEQLGSHEVDDDAEGKGRVDPVIIGRAASVQLIIY